MEGGEVAPALFLTLFGGPGKGNEGWGPWGSTAKNRENVH